MEQVKEYVSTALHLIKSIPIKETASMALLCWVFELNQAIIIYLVINILIAK